MRKLVIALSLTTAIFAATTAFFARELWRERERPARAVPISTAASRAAVDSPSARTAGKDETPAPIPASAAPDDDSLDPMQREKRRIAASAEQELAKLRDPPTRREMLDEIKANSRRAYPNLAQLLHLSDAEYDGLLELLAEQQITTRETMLRCSLDTQCRFPGIDRAYHDAQDIEVAALIGADRQQRFDKYQHSLNERRAVAQLRGLLPDKDHLSDEQSERLIVAIADEHQRFEAEITQRGTGVSGYSAGGFSFVLSPEEAGAEKRLAEATEYSHKIRERAAQILTASQLAVYDEMQAEAMRQLQFSLRENDKRLAKPER